MTTNKLTSIEIKTNMELYLSCASCATRDNVKIFSLRTAALSNGTQIIPYCESCAHEVGLFLIDAWRTPRQEEVTLYSLAVPLLLALDRFYAAYGYEPEPSSPMRTAQTHLQAQVYEAREERDFNYPPLSAALLRLVPFVRHMTTVSTDDTVTEELAEALQKVVQHVSGADHAQ